MYKICKRVTFIGKKNESQFSSKPHPAIVNSAMVNPSCQEYRRGDCGKLIFFMNGIYPPAKSFL